MTKKEIIGICEFLKIHHFENAYTLLEYIENLQKKAELGEYYKHLYSEVKKQKDDVVEYIKNNAEEYKWEDEDGAINKDYCCEGKVILRMLGEIDD